MNRRERFFFAWALAAAMVTIAMGAAIVLIALPHTPTRVALGTANDLTDAPTYVTLPFEIPDPRGFGAIARIWIVRDAQGDFTGLIGHNPLRDEPVIWQPVTNRFEAPVTGAKWDRFGKYLLPDVRLGADLDRYAVTVENGQVVVELRVISSVQLS